MFTTKSDFNEVIKDLVKTVDLEYMVTGIEKRRLLIVKCFNTDAKRSLMSERKQLKQRAM